jgi:NADH:ubiquinone oxidoreductase subunit D
MYESINIVFQILANLTDRSALASSSDVAGDTSTNFFNFFQTLHTQYAKRANFNTRYSSMESLITHFKHYSEGVSVPRGFVYKAVEAPKGEFGVSLISDGTANPYRCKIRTPAYHHMQVMSRMAQGHYFADLVTILGSLDIVFGDVDR